MEYSDINNIDEKLIIVLYEVVGQLDKPNTRLCDHLSKKYTIADCEKRVILEYAKEHGYILLTGGNSIKNTQFVEVVTNDILLLNKGITVAGMAVLFQLIKKVDKNLLLKIDCFFREHSYLVPVLVAVVYYIFGMLSKQIF